MNPTTSQNQLPDIVQGNQQEESSAFELTNSPTVLSNSGKESLLKVAFLLTISLLFIGIVPGGILLLFETAFNQDFNGKYNFWWKISATFFTLEADKLETFNAYLTRTQRQG